MRGPICFTVANEEGDGARRAMEYMGRGVAFHFRVSTTEIVLFTSNVWLHVIELQSYCRNSDWPLIDLSPDNRRQHDWQSDKDLRRELGNACHVIFPQTPEVQPLVQKSRQLSWFYRVCIMVNWAFLKTVRTLKGSKCHIWISKASAIHEKIQYLTVFF